MLLPRPCGRNTRGQGLGSVKDKWQFSLSIPDTHLNSAEGMEVHTG